ncbi:MAG: 6-carboxytetrahydropterin synthase [Burkholderiaceae bacterium]
MLLYTTFCFEASHSLQASVGVPAIHGHSYWARVWIESSSEQLTPLPSLEAEAKRVAGLLDHQHLNDLMVQQPTMEALVDFIRVQWQGPALRRVHVWRESLGCGVEWSAD